MKPKTDNISKTYSAGVRVLKNITLIAPKEIHQLLKLHDAGKSARMWFFVMLASVVFALVVGRPAQAQDKTSRIDENTNYQCL